MLEESGWGGGGGRSAPSSRKPDCGMLLSGVKTYSSFFKDHNHPTNAIYFTPSKVQTTSFLDQHLGLESHHVVCDNL